jgi:hypothetical protein
MENSADKKGQLINLEEYKSRKTEDQDIVKERRRKVAHRAFLRKYLPSVFSDVDNVRRFNDDDSADYSQVPSPNVDSNNLTGARLLHSRLRKETMQQYKKESERDDLPDNIVPFRSKKT